MKGKKGISIHIYLFIIAFMLGMVAFFVTLYKESREIDNYVGEYQLQMQKAANEGEKILLYVNEAAKLSFLKSTKQLAANGGVSEIEDYSDDFAYHECGKYKDAYVWFEITKDADGYEEKQCFLEEAIGANFENEFSENLNEYLELYPRKLPSDNYEFTFTETTVVGRAKAPVEIEILKKDPIFVKETTEIEETDSIDFIPSPAATGLVDFSDATFCKSGSCLLNEEAYSLLKKAQANAQKKGLSLEVTSSYRSREQQVAIWEGKTSARYAQRYPDEGERRKYVCYPYGDIQDCPHLTGKAVDVKLKGKSMSSKDWQELEDIMTDAGWVRYEKEPWHFECCNTKRYARARAQGTDVVA